MRAIIIDAVYRGYNTSYDTMSAIKQSLESLGIPTIIVSSDEVPTDKYDIAFYSFFIWDTRAFKKANADCHIYFQIEQLPSLRDKKSGLWANRWYRLRIAIKRYKFDYVFDYSWTNTEFIKSQGKKAIHCPWGYSPEFDICGSTKIGKKRLGVSFIGHITARRKKSLKRLRAGGTGVQILHRVGKAAAQMCIASKVCLNIHATRYPTFESGRIVALGMSNGCFVITEPYDPREVPFVDGQHLVVRSVKQMPKTIKHYLDHPEEAREIAERGYNYIKNNYTMTKNLKYALEEIGVL